MNPLVRQAKRTQSVLDGGMRHVHAGLSVIDWIGWMDYPRTPIGRAGVTNTGTGKKEF